MDLMGPMQIESIARKRYVYVCVDDFSRFTWVTFLITKFEAFEVFEELWQRLYKKHNNRLLKFSRIRNDHGKEFENSFFENLWWENDIEHEFLAPKNFKTKWSCQKKKHNPIIYGPSHAKS